MQGGSRPICPNCGQDNELESRFCRNCGNALALTCAHCGKDNEAGSSYCRHCGSALTANAGPASGPPTPVAPPAALVCPRCQHRNEPESQFCYNCGLPLTEEGGRLSTTRPGLQAFALGRPAGFWIRAGGLIIDTIIVLALFGLALLQFTDTSLAGYFSAGEVNLPLDLLSEAIRLAYATLLVGAFATTVGKRAFNMHIVRTDGTRVGYGRALGREAATILSLILLGVGYFMVAFRADKRALHDLIADTVVIRR